MISKSTKNPFNSNTKFINNFFFLKKKTNFWLTWLNLFSFQSLRLTGWRKTKFFLLFMIVFACPNQDTKIRLKKNPLTKISIKDPKLTDERWENLPVTMAVRPEPSRPSVTCSAVEYQLNPDAPLLLNGHISLSLSLCLISLLLQEFVIYRRRSRRV